MTHQPIADRLSTYSRRGTSGKGQSDVFTWLASVAGHTSSTRAQCREPSNCGEGWHKENVSTKSMGIQERQGVRLATGRRDGTSTAEIGFHVGPQLRAHDSLGKFKVSSSRVAGGTNECPGPAAVLRAGSAERVQWVRTCKNVERFGQLTRCRVDTLHPLSLPIDDGSRKAHSESPSTHENIQQTQQGRQGKQATNHSNADCTSICGSKSHAHGCHGGDPARGTIQDEHHKRQHVATSGGAGDASAKDAAVVVKVAHAALTDTAVVEQPPARSPGAYAPPHQAASAKSVIALHNIVQVERDISLP
eukprot:scaffold41244_cov30-Tisochrysis_lutea.AAC.7